MKPPPLAITCGDPAGVGPELVRRFLLENPREGSELVPLGPLSWLESLPVQGIPCDSEAPVRMIPGQPTAAGALCAWKALQLAAEGCADGRFRGVVTAPVSKEQLQAVGYPFPGQTEFFGEVWRGMPSMAFSGERLRVVLATWHEPLRDIPDRLRKEPDLLRRAVRATVEWGRRERLPYPRIAVCGLNPHAGEGGLLGSEESEFLDPLLHRLREETAAEISDCLPADTVFHRHLEGEFDFVIALYHDQGLIPVKTMEFHSAVNLTLGLPFVRTSPDHGTAFGLAGKGTARIDSLAHAVRLALRHTRDESDA